MLTWLVRPAAPAARFRGRPPQQFSGELPLAAAVPRRRSPTSAFLPARPPMTPTPTGQAPSLSLRRRPLAECILQSSVSDVAR